MREHANNLAAQAVVSIDRSSPTVLLILSPSCHGFSHDLSHKLLMILLVSYLKKPHMNYPVFVTLQQDGSDSDGNAIEEKEDDEEDDDENDEVQARLSSHDLSHELLMISFMISHMNYPVFVTLQQDERDSDGNAM